MKFAINKKVLIRFTIRLIVGLAMTATLALKIINTIVETHRSDQTFATISSTNKIEGTAYQQEIMKARKNLLAMMNECKMPGFAVAVSSSGKIVWSEGFGYADLEIKVPVNTNTQFRIASV